MRLFKSIFVLTAALLAAVPVFGLGKLQGYVERGGQAVSISGSSSTTKWQKSYPGATVTVYAAGTTTLSTIYSDASLTAKANPFTADSTSFWSFYAAEGDYDVRFSGGGIPTPWTVGALRIGPFTGSASVSINSFGAVADGNTSTGAGTDNSSAIQAAITSVGAGGTVVIPPGIYRFATTITVPRGVKLLGSGGSASTTTGSSVLMYSGASYGLDLGSNTDATGAFGITVESLEVLTTNLAAGGIRVRGTRQAQILNCYIEGKVGANTGIGILLAAGTAGNFFTNVMGTGVSHFKRGLQIQDSATTRVNTFNLNTYTDNIAGCAGIYIDTSAGDGSTFVGGNIEAFGTTAGSSAGIFTNSARATFVGIAFESGTAGDTELSLGANAQNNQFIGLLGLPTIASSGGSINNNYFVLNTDDTTARFPGNLQFRRPDGSVRYFITDSATTGSVVVQAGPGSGSLGGAFNLYGSSHASRPGWVTIGLGSADAGRKFTINNDGLGGGSDVFTVDVNGFVQLGTVAFASLGSPSNGTIVYCSNCTKATPCASGGGGAIAKRLGGAWDCD